MRRGSWGQSHEQIRVVNDNEHNRMVFPEAKLASRSSPGDNLDAEESGG
jgi:hypothetical protein